MAPRKKKAGRGKPVHVPPEYRDLRGRFKPGNPGGPGRPPLPIELENLRAILSVFTPDAWKTLAKVKLAAARKGDETAFAWGEKWCLGKATVADLNRATLGPLPIADEDRKKDPLALQEEILRHELLRILQNARTGLLTTGELTRVMEIHRLLTHSGSAEKTPSACDIGPN